MPLDRPAIGSVAGRIDEANHACQPIRQLSPDHPDLRIDDAYAAQRTWIALKRERVPGLPCADCGLPTRQWRAERLGCVRCGHRQEIARGDRREADPAHCEHCNP
jgi:2-keto-4-pentenoate hydratase